LVLLISCLAVDMLQCHLKVHFHLQHVLYNNSVFKKHFPLMGEKFLNKFGFTPLLIYQANLTSSVTGNSWQSLSPKNLALFQIAVWCLMGIIFSGWSACMVNEGFIKLTCSYPVTWCAVVWRYARLIGHTIWQCLFIPTHVPLLCLLPQPIFSNFFFIFDILYRNRTYLSMHVLQN